MTEADERGSSLPAIPDEEERVPSSLLEQHLINQERELKNESEELAIRRLEIDRSAESAQAYIRGELEDRNEERQAYSLTHKRNLFFCGFVVLCVSALALALIMTDKDPVLIELIKLIAAGGGGCGIGYYLGRSVEFRRQPEQE